jgi:hypothetical protein
LDRVLRYKLPDGRAAEHGLARLCREIEEHLGMVFHRFLTGEAHRVLPFAITLNGNPVDAWDPFARGEAATQRLERQTLELRSHGRSHPVTIQPYVLPNQMQFSTVRAWEEASGPEKWNRQQGFYIYRGDRMIQSGGWSRLRTSDEHTKLARIALDIPRTADSAFEINVSKMSVTIPAALRDELKAIASAVANKAQAAYRQQDGGAVRTARPRGGRRAAGGGADATRVGGQRGGERGSDGLVPWSLVESVLEREMASHQGMLRRIMAALRDAGVVPRGRND